MDFWQSVIDYNALYFCLFMLVTLIGLKHTKRGRKILGFFTRKDHKADWILMLMALVLLTGIIFNLVFTRGGLVALGFDFFASLFTWLTTIRYRH